MTIAPRIEQCGSSWKAVMDHPLREKVWDLLFEIQDRVVTLSNNGPTDISVKANEGYDRKDSLAVLLVAIYGATMTNIQALTNVIRTYEEHFSSLEKIIPPNYLISPIDLKPFLDEYIRVKVDILISKTLKENRIHTINQEWISQHRQGLIEARKRLEFTSFGTLTPWEKIKRVKLCNKVLDIIDRESVKVENINKTISNLLQERDQKVADLNELLKKNPVNCGDMLKDVIKECQRLSKLAKQEFDSFKSDLLLQWIDEAVDLTPPAPVK